MTIPPESSVRNLSIALAVASVSLFASGKASAQTGTGWRGGTSSDMQTPSNWDNGFGSNYNLFIGQAWHNAGRTGSTTINNASAYSGYRLNFENISGGANQVFTLQGSAISLFDFGGLSPAVINSSSVNQVINAPLVFNPGNTGVSLIQANSTTSGGNLTFSGTISLDTNGTGNQLRIGGASGRSITFGGVISATGANSVVANIGGSTTTTVYNAANTYNGDTFVDSGTLQFGTAASSAGSANNSILRLGQNAANSPAATINLATTTGGVNVGSTIVIRPSSSGTEGTRTLSSSNTSNTNTFSGAIALDTAATFSSSGTAAGVLAFTGATLELKTFGLLINGTGATTVSNVISSTGAGNQLTKAGSSTLTLSGANTFTGGVTIGQGTVSVATIGNQNATSSNLGGAFSTINFGSTTNTGQLTYTGTGETTDRVINLAGTTGGAQINANGTLAALIFSSNVTATGAGAKTLTLSGSSTVGINTLQGTIGDSTGGATAVTKTGAATWSLTGTTNSFTGSLNVNQGILNAATISNTGTNSSIGAGGGITAQTSSGGTGTLRITGAGGTTNRAITINGTNTGAGTGSGLVIDSSGTAPVTFTGGITAGSTAQVSTTSFNTLTLTGSNTNYTGVNTVSGNITDFSTTVGSERLVAVTKGNNSAVWVLSGIGNNYTGATTIQGGTLAGIGANAFGNTSGIGIAGTGLLSLRGDTSTSFVRPANGASYAVNTTASGVTINVDQATAAGTGAKTMTIGMLGTSSVAQSYTLNFTGANNTSLSVGAVTGPASAPTTNPATVTIANAIPGGGSLTLASYTSANTTVGENLIFNGGGNTTVTGAITPSAQPLRLTQSGTGTVTLNGNSSYTGITQVNGGGTLLVNGNNSAATGAVTASVLGTTLGGTGTIGGAVTISGPAQITGGTAGTVGALTLASSLTLAGTSGNLATYLVDLTAMTSDLLSVGGNVDLSNGFDQISFSGSTGAASYTLLSYTGTLTGTFNNAILPSGYSLNYGTGSNSSITLTAVPEPSTWIGAGLITSLAAWSQRRRLDVRNPFAVA